MYILASVKSQYSRTVPYFGFAASLSSLATPWSFQIWCCPKEARPKASQMAMNGD